MLNNRFVAVLLLALATAACTAPGSGGDTARPTVACAAPLKPAIEHHVYFGRALPNGSEIGEAQWARFVAEVVTPRFPDGLSVLNVAGQSRNGVANRTLREHTKLLVVVVPAGQAQSSAARVDEVAAAYRARFAGRAVFHVDRPVCASL